MPLDQIEKFKVWQLGAKNVCKKYGDNLDKERFKSRIVSSIISLMIDNLCENTNQNLIENGIETVEDVQNYKGVLAIFSPGLREEITKMRKFLYDEFYMSKKVSEMNLKGVNMIKDLFMFYHDNPKKFPKFTSKDDLVVDIKDYIAGMTDGFLLQECEKVLGKK